MEPEHPKLSLRRQCELLGVNRSSFYYESNKIISYSEDKLKLLNLIDEVYTQYPFFGTRQMASYLQLQGHANIARHHTRWGYNKLGLKS